MTSTIIRGPFRLAIHSLACRSTGLDSGLMVGSLSTLPGAPKDSRPMSRDHPCP